MNNTSVHISEIKARAMEIRKSVISSLTAAGSGHLGGSLGLADIFACLHFSFMSHKPDNPNWIDRDRLILSIGHVAPVLYASLAHAGYFPIEELNTLRKFESRLQGHPGRDHGLPGIELSAGSLGQGLSVAVGIALASKMDQRKNRIISIHGDGELQEGSIWEAAMSAAHHKLDNLIAIVDRNFCQIDGRTEDVMALEPLAAKWESFGWNTLKLNGNNVSEILQALDEADSFQGKPSVLIAKTLMGKGVPAIEDDYKWHGKAPSEAEARLFIQELEKNQ